ncbi:MAG: glycosyltransferase [Kiritimatiellae bacterium]|nr:glycosyltransferase [Kiritimatiellia bacterium]
MPRLKGRWFGLRAESGTTLNLKPSNQARSADSNQQRSCGSNQARSADSNQQRSCGSNQARSADSNQQRSCGSNQARSAGSNQAVRPAQTSGASRVRTSSEWVLVIAGSGDRRYEEALKRQVEGAGLGGSVKFIGAVFGEAKVKLMKAAEVFVLPTKNENFGIVVAESLACGVPVITTKGAPWAELLGSSAQGRSCAAGLSRHFAPGLSRDCVTGLNAADAAGLSGASQTAKGLDGDGYCDHKVVAMTRLKGCWFGLRAGSRSTGSEEKHSGGCAPVEQLKEQQAESSCGAAGEATLNLKPSNQQRSCGLNQAVRPAQTSPEGAGQTSGDSRSGWWVDVGVEPLAEALAEAMSLSDEERAAMGRNGRRLVEERYQWRAVARRMVGVYAGVIATTDCDH